MSVIELFAELRKTGLAVRLDGPELVVSPRSALTPGLADTIRAQKRQLVRLVQARDLLNRMLGDSATFRIGGEDTLLWLGPSSAVGPETTAEVARLKSEIISLLRAGHSRSRRTWGEPTEQDWRAHPFAPQDAGPSRWPDELPGIGPRRLCAFSPCILSGEGSWAEYGGMALCRVCAWAPETSLRLRYRLVLLRCWALLSDGGRAEAAHALAEATKLQDEVGEPTATNLRRQWAAEWWHQKKTCPTCGGPVLHDPDTGQDTAR